ncbi:NnrS family protein [Dinoroseobacter sp. PD6]|uniref:NnrS family protein n=1 Tax=Dinoroseobacter sp. PD6 TaxID=3028384 RepID=UPI00237B2852|nr:NnrS family protein [Dinoroseobacter sp. PD6]MDD9715717.1 NnrS family protein [Dinoroseobacter sp. PD6]
MSCGPATGHDRPLPRGWRATLGDEGFRLFFALGALYAALFPLLWVVAWGLSLPLAQEVPPGLWHAHEMLIGAFGAALIGFVTTAAPEWTDTAPPRGRPLWALAGLWGLGRLVGLPGWEAAGLLGALADLGWMLALIAWLVALSLRRRTDRLVAFIFWLALLAATTATARLGFATGDLARATLGLHLAGFAFLGLLGLALSRITAPITNLVLDPTERTSPFRPHPGRLHLAPGLVLLAMAGEALGVSAAVSAWLLIAAGAAFMDRVGEAFIGREAARTEILMLAGSSALAGLGLMLAGAARLGAPWPDVTGLHIAFMGGLGLGVYAVYCIAGCLHTGQPLGLSRPARLGACALVAAVLLRVAPDFGINLPLPTMALAATAWGGGFLLWLAAYWPALSRITPPVARPGSAEAAPPPTAAAPYPAAAE